MEESEIIENYIQILYPHIQRCYLESIENPSMEASSIRMLNDIEVKLDILKAKINYLTGQNEH